LVVDSRQPHLAAKADVSAGLRPATRRIVGGRFRSKNWAHLPHAVECARPMNLVPMSATPSGPVACAGLTFERVSFAMVTTSEQLG